jgi:hypothetical protein
VPPFSCSTLKMEASVVSGASETVCPITLFHGLNLLSFDDSSDEIEPDCLTVTSRCWPTQPRPFLLPPDKLSLLFFYDILGPDIDLENNNYIKMFFSLPPERRCGQIGPYYFLDHIPTSSHASVYSSVCAKMFSCHQSCQC